MSRGKACHGSPHFGERFRPCRNQAGSNGWRKMHWMPVASEDLYQHDAIWRPVPSVHNVTIFDRFFFPGCVPKEQSFAQKATVNAVVGVLRLFRTTVLFALSNELTRNSTVTKSYRDVIIPLLFDASLEHVMRRCKLLGIEQAGRWRNEAANFTRMLAQTTARSSPPSLRAAPTFALVSRWPALR